MKKNIVIAILVLIIAAFAYVGFRVLMWYLSLGYFGRAAVKFLWRNFITG